MQNKNNMETKMEVRQPPFFSFCVLVQLKLLFFVVTLSASLILLGLYRSRIIFRVA